MQDNGEGPIQDRRKDPRRQVKFVALLKVGVYIQGRGYVKNVSLGGMCLKAQNAFTLLRPATVSKLEGSAIKVVFPSQSITIMGTVLRVNVRKEEIALTVTETTDDELWQTMCA